MARRTRKTSPETHPIQGIENVKTFALAGKAILTVRNDETEGRFTFRVRQIKDAKGEPISRWFVDVLTGPDNRRNYTFIGWLDANGFHHSQKAGISQTAPSVVGFQWFWRQAQHKVELPTKVSVFHEGYCGCCGALLTVPESVSCGYGPDCAKALGVPWTI